MAEYLIQGETLESMADKIRILNGVSGNMTPAQMDGNLGEANTEVSEQADLIAQISSALEGKAGSGGGITLPTLSNPAASENLELGYELIDGDGNIVIGTHVCESGGSGDGDIMYFTVQNNLPDELFVNGIHCSIGDITAIPYSEATAYILFMIHMSEEYTISAPYKMLNEDENGELFEEDMDGAPMYLRNEELAFISGVLFDFNPNYSNAVNNTITFEAIY